MGKAKKLIIVIIFIIFIIIGIVTFLLININKVQSQEDYEKEAYNELKEINNRETFYNINNSINKYLAHVANKNTDAIKAIEKDSQNSILDNITRYNIIPKFYSQEMYSIDKVTNITAYVKGVIRNNNNEDTYYFIVNLDYNNNTYCITNSNKEEYDKATNNTINSKYLETLSIQNNQYNEIDKTKITDFNILTIYFEDFKFKAINKQDEAFAQIDSEYKAKRFNNDINEFKTYITENINRIQDSNIVKHGITKNGQYGEYIVIDSYNNYYKIIETAINEYTIILDNYTIEDSKITDEYNKLLPREKVTSNIDKIMKLINSKDYNRLYSYLNKDFKSRNFNTLEAFEQYINKTFFDNNIMGIPTIKNEGNLYIITVSYKESLSSAAEQRQKKLIMKLGTGTDFELSFEM